MKSVVCFSNPREFRDTCPFCSLLFKDDDDDFIFFSVAFVEL